MPDEEELFALQGINRAAPAGQHDGGECLAIQNLVPQGPADTRHWAAPQPGMDISTDHDYLSIGWQTRSNLGALANTDTDPGQSLNRLVGLTAGGLFTIDPGQSYLEKRLWRFDMRDDSRRASFAEVGDTLFVCVTSGCRDVDELLWVRGDQAARASWPALPLLNVSWTDTGSDTALPEGTYVFRIAWRLDDGTIGPSSGPYRVDTGSTSSSGFEFTFAVGRYTQPLSRAWEERLSDLVVLAQIPAVGEDGTRTVKAIQEPAYRITTLGPETGDEVTWSDSREGVISSQVYDGMGLGQHDRLAGTVYNYNKRLLLGDAAYDLYRPELEKIVEWTDGVHNGGGNDQWLMMEVEVETANGTVRRVSDPLPFDTSHAEAVALRSNTIWYRDGRALRWAWYVSSDYSGDIEAATWSRVTMPAARSFTEAAGSNVAFKDVGQGAINITVTDDLTVDVTEDPNWSGQKRSSEVDTGYGTTIRNSPNTASVAISDVLAGTGASAARVRFALSVGATNDANNDSTASCDITVRVKDENDNILDTQTESLSYSGVNRTEPGRIVLDSYTASAAGVIEIDTTASASVKSDTNDDSWARAAAVVADVELTVDGTTQSVPVSRDPQLDRDANRITWSEPFRPLDIPPDQVVFAGDRADSPVMALQAVGQEVSEGQFGEYPILCFQKLGVRALQVSKEEPFIQGVNLLEADAGLVSRNATTALGGKVVAALTDGVRAFRPQPAETPLSAPLHDKEGRFLSDLRSGAALTTFTDSTVGRKELWVAFNQRTYVYSARHGTWSTLTRARADFAPGDQTVGVGWDGQIVVEEGAPDTAPDTAGQAAEALSAEVVTAPFSLGPVGRLERIQRLMIERYRTPGEVRWELYAMDPDTAGAGLGDEKRATLPGGEKSEELIPSVLVASGTMGDTDMGTVWLKKGLGYAWWLRLEATAAPGESIDAFGAHFDRRRPLRATELFPTLPDIVGRRMPLDDTTERCPSDGRTGNVPPMWESKADLAYGPGNTAPQWESGGALEWDPQEESDFNRAPQWEDKGALAFDPETAEEEFDPYEAPTVGDTIYVFTAGGGFSRFAHQDSGFPVSAYQNLNSDPAGAELAVDYGAGQVFLAAPDGIWRYDLLGQNETQILSGKDVAGVAADPLTTTLYASYKATGGIQSMEYDGSGASSFAAGSKQGYDLAVAPSGGNRGFLFGASTTENEVVRWLLSDGTETTLKDGGAVGTTIARHVAVHLGRARVFYQFSRRENIRRVRSNNFQGTDEAGLFVNNARRTKKIRDRTEWDILEDEEQLLELRETEDGALSAATYNLDGSSRAHRTDSSQTYDTGAYVRSAAAISE